MNCQAEKMTLTGSRLAPRTLLGHRTMALVEGSLFEALFVKALKPTGAFADELLVLGVDVKSIAARYESEQWVKAQLLAAKYAFGHLPEAKAHRMVGRALLEGFLKTLVGRLIEVAIPFMNPQQFLLRAPRFMRMGSPSEVVTATVVDDTHVQLTVRPRIGTHAAAYAGVLEVGLERLNCIADVQVASDSPEHIELLAGWTKKK